MMGGGGGGGVNTSGSINFSVCTSVIVVVVAFSVVVVVSFLGFSVNGSLSARKTSERNYEANTFPTSFQKRPSFAYPL